MKRRRRDVVSRRQDVVSVGRDVARRVVDRQRRQRHRTGEHVTPTSRPEDLNGPKVDGNHDGERNEERQHGRVDGKRVIVDAARHLVPTAVVRHEHRVPVAGAFDHQRSGHGGRHAPRRK